MSEFWTRKMRTYFTRIDFDKDGSITQKDFEAMATRFIESEKLDAKRGADLRHKLIEIWEKFLKDVASGHSLTQPLFIESMKKQVHDPALKKTLSGPLPIFFGAVDANGDGMIQQDEFQLFFQILGLDPKLATDSFKAIDTNSDGQLSLEEFVHAGTEFFTSEDEKCPSKLFWGPLVH
jgi:Ca2+-binding EF-hand superfamily protein